MDAVSLCLNYSLEWKDQQMLCSDYLSNAPLGDEEALLYTYDCKLVHMMETYDIFDYLEENIERDKKLDNMLADTRFRSTSYYIESLGVPAPYLVEFVKTNYAYIRAARVKVEEVRVIKANTIEANRMKHQIKINQIELDNYKEQFRNVKHIIDTTTAELNMARDEFNRLKDIVQVHFFFTYLPLLSITSLHFTSSPLASLHFTSSHFTLLYNSLIHFKLPSHFYLRLLHFNSLHFTSLPTVH